MITQQKIHPDLQYANKLAYSPHNLECNNVYIETESQEYGACTFILRKKDIIFRVAKITPTKIGQFVTFWKRRENGPIMPYDASDSFDFLIVSVRTENNFGQFVFPKQELLKRDVISKEGIGGKRALRVYPPWDITDNKQAKKSQAWQIDYFFEIEPVLANQKLQKLLFD